MITAAEYISMRADMATSLLDTCILGVPGAQTGPEPTVTYAYTGSAIACGFNADPSREGNGDAPQVTQAEAVLRLPLTAAVTQDSRIALTHRNGAALSGTEYYAVIGAPRRGPTAYVCEIRRLTGGNAR